MMRKTTMAALAAGVVMGAGVGLTGLAQAAPGDDARHGKVDLPTWVVRPCSGKYDVNCRHDDARHVSIVRAVPGSAHMVCVFYAQRAYARTHDYCD